MLDDNSVPICWKRWYNAHKLQIHYVITSHRCASPTSWWFDHRSFIHTQWKGFSAQQILLIHWQSRFALFRYITLSDQSLRSEGGHGGYGLGHGSHRGYGRDGGGCRGGHSCNCRFGKSFVSKRRVKLLQLVVSCIQAGVAKGCNHTEAQRL